MHTDSAHRKAQISVNLILFEYNVKKIVLKV